MGVMLQAFYWDCPAIDNQAFQWWNFIRTRIPDIAAAGFTALWLPPASKAASCNSMGYDLYDYYDFGSIDQKGAASTWFGSAAELVQLIDAIHEAGMQVYADLVFHQNSGADAAEINPIDGISRWTKFTPGSNRFSRDYQDFQPSIYETIDGLQPVSFGGMPNLCHRNPYVYTQIIEYGKFLLEDMKFDGFRYDCVSGYGAWMVRAIQELRTNKNNASYRPFGVGECFAADNIIDEWLQQANAWSDNPCLAFDFPLRFKLKSLCDRFGFSLNRLCEPNTLLSQDPALAVTFVENHDVSRSEPIVQDKMLAYSFILTHQGYPCVFWQDYYNYGLSQTGQRSGIHALIEAHEKYAGGEMDILHRDDNLYIMQRKGFQNQPGLIYVLNNSGAWNGATVQTGWVNTNFQPFAWWGRENTDTPIAKSTNEHGTADFWAPPRGYVVYVPLAL